jgi:hypothetical protein
VLLPTYDAFSAPMEETAAPPPPTPQSNCGEKYSVWIRLMTPGQNGNLLPIPSVTGGRHIINLAAVCDELF